MVFLSQIIPYKQKIWHSTVYQSKKQKIVFSRQVKKLLTIIKKKKRLAEKKKTNHISVYKFNASYCISQIIPHN